MARLGMGEGAEERANTQLRRLSGLLVALATLLLTVLAQAPPAAASLAGEGLDFGEVGVGRYSVPQDLTLTNTGTSTLVIEEIDLAGPHGTEFAVTYHGCSGARLAYGQSCQIQIQAIPSGTGVRTGTLVVEHSDSSSPDAFTLTVIGRARGSAPAHGGSGSGPGGSAPGSGASRSQAPRIHTRAGLLDLGWGRRVAVATASCPAAARRSCHLAGSAYVALRGRRSWASVRAPFRIPAGSWARVFVVVPGWTVRRLATARRLATLVVRLNGYGPDGARSHAFMRRLLIP